MRNIAILALLLGFLCASCASTKTDWATAPVAMTSTEYGNQDADSIAGRVIKTDTAKLETNDPVHISVEYPVFHQEKIDAAVLAWARDRLEREQSHFRDLTDESAFEPAEGLSQEDIDAELARMREERKDYMYECTASVLEYDPEQGASILFSESAFAGGAHGSYNFATLILDEKGLETDPWEVFPSPSEGAKILSDACREQFSHTELDRDMYMDGTKPDPINFRWMVRRGDYIVVYFEPYAVATWADGPQVCVYKLP